MPVSSDVKLMVYNGALLRLGARRLASIDENREPRRVLDQWWGPEDNVVRWALERGGWNFAIRSQKLDYTPSVTPSFGLSRAFSKPQDLVRLETISASEYFTQPLTAVQYVDEAGYWLSDLDTVYVRYVSKDDRYGLDTDRWPEDFRNLIECYLAYSACERVANDSQMKAMLGRDLDRTLSEAKASDSVDEGVKFRPAGSWVQSRGAYSRSRWR